jgi:hypothetical protein
MWTTLTRIFGRRRADPAAFGAVYYLGGRFYIPALSRTPDGIYIECEPVEVFSAPTADDLAGALGRVREASVRTVPTPPRDGYPRPVVRRHAKIRTEREFERMARHWTVDWVSDSIALIPSMRAPGGGFCYKPKQAEWFSGPDALLRVAKRLLEITR